MYLKKLEMQGFKSFVDKITLNFENGITAIVGPNGSGKSNISDAIRWCLGEQSAKSLRGSRMEDIIFAGTEKRKALGFADVTIVFDNSSYIFPIEYDEVAVTRRVYRSGESEYFINKSSCRLKDVHELFMDTGIGRDGYSIIGQGRIDEILSTKSEDRRQIFEEAAGISKYKYRKNDAEKKLRATDDNLQRAGDIINELELTLEPLKQQSEKARQFLDLREKLKKIEVSLALDMIDSGRLIIAQLTEKYKQDHAALEAEKSHQELKEERLDQLYLDMQESDRDMAQKTQAIHKNELEITQKRSQIELFKNNIENTGRDRERLGNEIFYLSTRQDTLKSEICENENKLKELRELFAQQESSLAKGNEQVQAYANELSEQYKLIDEHNLKIEHIDKDSEALRSELVAIDTLFKNRKERSVAVENHINAAKEELAQLGQRLNQLLAEKQNRIQKRIDTNQQLAQLEDKLTNAKNQIKALKEQYNSLVYSLNATGERKKLLDEMEREMSGYQKSVKATLEHFKNHEKVRGVLGRLITAKPEYLTAIEIALGAAAQNIVVDDEEMAKTAIEYLKKNKGGRCTFLPISAVTPYYLNELDAIKKNPGVIASAAELVETNAAYLGIVKNILGRIVIVDNMDNAIALSRRFKNRFRIVTMAGESLNAGGSITGGSIQESARLLGRQNEIKSLGEKIAKLTTQVEKVEDNIDFQEETLHSLEIQRENVIKDINATEVSIIKQEGEIQLNNRLTTDKKNELQTLEQEKQRIEDFIENSEEKKGKIDLALKMLSEHRAESKKEGQGLSDALNKMINQRDNLASQLLELKMQINSMSKDMEMLQTKIDAAYSEIKTTTMQIESKLQNQKELETHSSGMEKDIGKIQLAIASLGDQIAVLKDEVEQRHKEKSGADAEMNRLRDETKQLTVEIMGKQQELSRLETKMSRAQSELEGYITRLWDDYELTYSGACELRSEIGAPDAAKRRVSELKSAIKSLGNINIDSIEEYKTVSQRYQFLTEQRKDLLEAKASLEKLIEDMTKIMTEQFAEAFAQINEKFNETFATLFGGGRAHLTITDPNNLLETGIEIDVCPPGKKLQSLMLLSGGERAFTAIALLFAILSIRPTPFCILDEIEAALDEVNVARFAAYVKNYSHNTQFIIVTHRRGTMEAADMLYGVTMQEKGVSQLLEMKPDKIPEKMEYSYVENMNKI